MAKYAINKDLNGVITRDVEADSYVQDGEFFHFKKGSGTTAKKVFTIATKSVHTIEVAAE